MADASKRLRDAAPSTPPKKHQRTAPSLDIDALEGARGVVDDSGGHPSAAHHGPTAAPQPAPTPAPATVLPPAAAAEPVAGAIGPAPPPVVAVNGVNGVHADSVPAVPPTSTASEPAASGSKQVPALDGGTTSECKAGDAAAAPISAGLAWSLPPQPHRKLTMPTLALCLNGDASTKSERVTGPGGTQWALFVFPRGDSKARSDRLSVFIDVDQRQWPLGFSVRTRIQFKVLPPPSRPTLATLPFTMANHVYDGTFPNWGKPGWDRIDRFREEGYVEDDTIRVSADVYCFRPSLDASMGSLALTRREVGMVGIRNQGATCYMNSLLQTLFHTRLFRKAVFEVPISPEQVDQSGRGSCVQSLQDLFLDMQTQERPVSTRQLTASFGWDSYQAFQQHDVQELLRVLLDEVERLMQKTVMEKCVSHLLQGVMVTTIRCDHVDYASHRREEFFDIQLTVKNCASLTDSLKLWIAEERLDGDNKYHAGDHGKQDATKFVKFARLPPVLHLQLKRFEFDMVTMGMSKVNTRFEFPEVLDMAPYMTDLPPEEPAAPDAAAADTASNGASAGAGAASASMNSDGGNHDDAGKAAGRGEETKDTPSVSAAATAHAAARAASAAGTRYLLHSVLVHSGGVHGGHYYAFVRPKLGRGGGDAAAPAGASDAATTADTAAPSVADAPPSVVLHDADDAEASKDDDGDVDVDRSAPAPVPEFDHEAASLLGDELPKQKLEWYKFDDAAVAPCSKTAAMDANFGDNPPPSSRYHLGAGTSAYMLVYIKESALADVMFDQLVDDSGRVVDDGAPVYSPSAPGAPAVGDDSKLDDDAEAAEERPYFVDASMPVPTSIMTRRQQQAEARLERERRKTEAQASTPLYIITERDVALVPRYFLYGVQHGNKPDDVMADVMDWVDLRTHLLPNVSVSRHAPMHTCIPIVAKKLGLEADRFRFRVLGLITPTSPCGLDKPEVMCNQSATCSVYVEECGPCPPAPPPTRWQPELPGEGVATTRAGFVPADGTRLYNQGRPVVLPGVLPGGTDLIVPSMDPSGPEDGLLVFFWLFVPGVDSLWPALYMGAPLLPGAMTMRRIHTMVRRWLGLPDTAAVGVFELFENPAAPLTKLPDTDQTMVDMHLQTGDVLWVEPTELVPEVAARLSLATAAAPSTAPSPAPAAAPGADAAATSTPSVAAASAASGAGVAEGKAVEAAGATDGGADDEDAEAVAMGPEPPPMLDPRLSVMEWMDTHLSDVWMHLRMVGRRRKKGGALSIQGLGASEDEDGTAQLIVPPSASVARVAALLAAELNARISGAVPLLDEDELFDRAIATWRDPEGTAPLTTTPVAPAHVQFTLAYARNRDGRPRPRPTPLPLSLMETVDQPARHLVKDQIRGPKDDEYHPPYAFYEIMDRPVAELEDSQRLAVRWLGCDTVVLKSYEGQPGFGDSVSMDGVPEAELYLPKDATVRDAAAELRRLLQLPRDLRLRGTVYANYGLAAVLVDDDLVADVRHYVNDALGKPTKAVVFEPVTVDEPPLPQLGSIHATPIPGADVEWVMFGQHTMRPYEHKATMAGRAYLVPVTQFTTLAEVVLPTLKRMGRSLEFMKCKGRGLSSIVLGRPEEVDYSKDADAPVCTLRSVFEPVSADAPPVLPEAPLHPAPLLSQADAAAAAATALPPPGSATGPTTSAATAVTTASAGAGVDDPANITPVGSAAASLDSAVLRGGGSEGQALLEGEDFGDSKDAFQQNRLIMGKTDDGDDAFQPLSPQSTATEEGDATRMPGAFQAFQPASSVVPRRLLNNPAPSGYELMQPTPLRDATANVWHLRQAYWSSLRFVPMSMWALGLSNLPLEDALEVRSHGTMLGALVQVGVTQPTLLPLPVLSIRQLDASEATDLCSPARGGGLHGGFLGGGDALVIKKWDQAK